MTEYVLNFAAALSMAIEKPIFEHTPTSSALIHDGELWVFVDAADIASPASLKAAVHIYDAPLPDKVSAVYFVLSRWLPDENEKVSLALGRSAVSVRFALRKLLDLPSTFEMSQEASIQEALAPIRQLDVDPISMRLVGTNKNYENASQALSEMIRAPQSSGGGLIFVEAEAGKGKTILLASTAHMLREDKRGKLPIFIPLRKLPLESGVAWESITQLIGVVGEGSERLVRAVKSGLATVFLDGIDEVSGRYDKNVIRDLLQLMTDRLGSKDSVVILSGRRTEARHLNTDVWNVLSIELPDLTSPDFRHYVSSVLSGIIQQRSQPTYVPAKYLELIGDRPADEQVNRERDDIINWILDIFPEVAKEPSLFFVQGLVAIAIGRRAGNRATLKGQDNKPYLPPISDVCLSAAVFACIRESSKVDQVAIHEYSVENQMQALQGLAALASAPNMVGVPTPNELVPESFQVDPVNLPEVYVAITRQNAKHALLYATEAVGGYRPQFLSDWIRCALLAQTLNCPVPMGKLLRNEVLKLAVSAERAKYAFDVLVPSLLEQEPAPVEWLDAFQDAISAGYETASANQWILRASLGDERLTRRVNGPLPLAEITDTEFSGFTIGDELCGNDFFLDGSVFANSTISGVRLNSVSMQAVVFMGCDITGMELHDCEGPLTFVDCTLRGVVISNTQSSTKPALSFDTCAFLGDENRLSQQKPAYGNQDYGQVVCFNESYTEGNIERLLEGDWAGSEKPLTGICKKEPHTERHAVTCLRRALRTFFPSHTGSGTALQARRYIRLSALGRGSMPPGSPGQERLQQIFESVGFTTGGRADHLYGPWAGVVGVGLAGIDLRNELVEFLHDSSKQGSTVKKMIGKIEQYFQGG
ncbi:NACHT domain-containing protein [Pseudomonas syringae pv. atrofaciens]|uniref:NACHT domain-containing protein n=1 Tax=Pseudomonas syringae TaxID=317 RepID=UPI00351DC960